MKRLKRNGASLIIALAAMALLVTIVVNAASIQTYRMKAEKNRIDKRNAFRMAQAGVQRALVEFEDIDVNLVSLTDAWATTTSKGNERFLVGNDSFRFEIVDACSYVNLNTITEEMLTNLALTTEQIDSLLDWRETGSVARTEGAKDSYYNVLENGYNAKLGNFDTVDELLLVRGFTPPDLYELQTNTTATVPTVPLYLLLTTESSCPNTTVSGGTKLNPNSAQLNEMVQAGVSQQLAQQIVNRRNQGQFSSMADLFAIPGLTVSDAAAILENFTLNTATQLDGRINLNTAPKAVLEALPGATDDIVNALLSTQDTTFASLADLGNVAGITVDLIRQWADLVTVGSQTFIVRSVGTSGRASVTLEALVKVVDGNATIIKYLTPPYQDMASRWEWDTDVSNESILVSNE